MENDYISREDAKKTMARFIGYGPIDDDMIVRFRIAIDRILPADVRPVVRGEWKDAIQGAGDSPHVKCSVCGEYYWKHFRIFRFCPNCGAKMGGADG